MAKGLFSLIFLLFPAVNALAVEPKTCISGTFRGADYTGFEKRCDYVCRSGMKIQITQVGIDGLDGGLFSVYDADNKQLFRGYTDSAHLKYHAGFQASPGKHDPGLSMEGLAVKFCRE